MRAAPLLALALAGCAAGVGTSGPVALDQTQRAGPLLVTPVKVVEDSRCPDDARCFAPGRVVVRAVVEDGWGQVERRFTLGEPADVGSGRLLVLDGVTPGRSRELTAFTGPYRFHFSAVRRDGRPPAPAALAPPTA